MVDGHPQAPYFKHFLKRNFSMSDPIKMLLSAALGLGIKAIIDDDWQAGTTLLVIVVIAASAVILLDRFRVSLESAFDRELRTTHDDVANHLGDLREQLDKHLHGVHAGVKFVPDKGPTKNTSSPAGYDVATAAVQRAKQKIFVIGDYSPPPEEGATLDPGPPVHRSDYLRAIEEKLLDRLDPAKKPVGRLTYFRFIQRPTDVFERIRARAASTGAGVILSDDDMKGDMQAFEHCEEVLKIAALAEERGMQNRIDIHVRLIPFLPNSPSILLVDNQEIQFTIPTRIDQPGDNFAHLGLQGVLVMEDKANGAELCNHFRSVFEKLQSHDLKVKKIESHSPLRTDV